MKNTYEIRLKEIAENAQNYNDLMNNIEPVIYEIINEDKKVLSVYKRFAGYGTWNVYLHSNQYTFGEEINNILNKIYIVTHDEDKEFTILDFAEEIRERIAGYVYLTWF